MNAKDNRLSRIINPETNKTLIIPMDHLWILTKPIPGYPNLLMKQVANSWADAILDHLWPMKNSFIAQWLSRRVASILHMSLSSTLNKWNGDSKIIVNNMETALRLWFDWVSMQVNMWHEDDNRMIEDLWAMANECDKWWMPLIAMMYVRSKEINNEKVTPEQIQNTVANADKLWVDIIKIPYTGSTESMKDIVQSVNAHIVVAWGSKVSDSDTLKMVADVMDAGCAWVCMWRNSVERTNVEQFIWVVSKMVHDNLSFKDAKKILKLK